MKMPPIISQVFDDEEFTFANFYNSFLHTYLLALGEFDFEDFGARGVFS